MKGSNTMFLLDFSFDDFAEGGVGFGLKSIITLALIAVIVLFFRIEDESVIYGTITFSLALAVLIINIIMFIVGAYKTRNAIKNKDENKDKMIKGYSISLILFIILSIIGYFVSITIWKITIQKIISMFLLPIISEIILILSFNLDFLNKRMKVINYISFIIGYLITLVFLSSILFFFATIFHRFGIQDSDFVDTKFGHSARSFFNYVEKNARYYDSSYDNMRNNSDIKDILQKKVNEIIELSSNEEEINRLAQLMNLSDGEINNLRNDKLSFLTTYANSKTSMSEFKNTYGLNMKFLTPFYRCENYKNNYVLTTYDRSTKISHFYLFNTETFTINDEIPKNEYSDYVNKIIQEAKNNHEYN